jgi:uncharacterized membrane protein YphA (DoxX/SURF4 family)
MNITKIIFFLITIYVGGFMLYGGYQKFAKPLPTPTKMIETFEKEGAKKMKEDKKLVIKNYIFGLKQTGFFWQFLGICEILFALMIISQYLRFIGAVMLVPITLQIFLFHLFLELDDIEELIETGLLFLGNLALIFKEFKHWKHLIITNKF